MKNIILIIGLLLVTLSSKAQMRYNLDFGIRAGAANYLGDIGGGDLARNFVFNLENPLKP